MPDLLSTLWEDLATRHACEIIVFISKILGMDYRNTFYCILEFQKMLQIDVFPESVFLTEEKYYQTKMNEVWCAI